VAAQSRTASAGDASHAARFAQGLQQAGYATDPAYAEKLSRVINTTLRLQRTLNA
jgi:flagellar protein FlgJ